jgi:hypothetical protein
VNVRRFISLTAVEVKSVGPNAHHCWHGQILKIPTRAVNR